MQLLIKGDRELIKTKIRNFRIKLEYLAIRLKLKRAKVARISFVDGIPQYQNKNIKIIMHNALKTYEIKPANFDLELIKAQKSTFYIRDRATYGWRDYALKELNMAIMPGEHSKLFSDENSKDFAQKLDKIMERYDKRYTSDMPSDMPSGYAK
ncbi:MAG: hypothetical protein MZW92_32610 [Comamonadaceae bacterium]|nr:hypothetical protein [Comamonadaceae bacterium]